MILDNTQLTDVCKDIAQGNRSGVTLRYTENGFRIFSPSYGYAYSSIRGNKQIPIQQFSIVSLYDMDVHSEDLLGIWLNEQDNTVSMTFSNYTEDESEARQYCAKTQQIGYYSFSQGKTVYL